MLKQIKKPMILVVDDEEELVKALRDRLHFEGFDTVAAFEGVRAIEMANKHNPDLILLDLRMPAGNGQSVLKSLKSRLQTEKIPVIVISALEGFHLEEELLSGGAIDFIRKPYDWGELLEKIRKTLL